MLLYIDAPHGRAANPRGLNVNGNVAWLLMELVSPITCFLAACSEPFESTPNAMLLPSFQNFDMHRIRALPAARLSLLLAFLLHYLHRSLISTLRNPGRSPMHVSVPISAMVFNLLNGYLIGSWLSGRCLSVPHNPVHTPSSSLGPAWAQFSLYMVGWALGFGSNIAHDELLSRLRRSSKTKARYSVPHGLLYSSPFGGISCPHYLSELFEWLTFAGAASVAVHQLEQTSSVCDHDLFHSPPGLFFLAMVAVLMPRAIRTHRWYVKRFGGLIPNNRRAIIPGLL
ncbi:hypothetical protein CROQUDRAFT_40514 [Cronartium quercuum f. sp. fusiforme G11]|uniref:3-oxo-5-alpha-steroid 4-dehydrogenase C-terminal domain-containing protein n=1 Tax=Cronartium quercuum f. sp. fusiforme G11 TaxID=708437 RepID=A0A9P6TFQ0_9BASI|nr:hypothetical protein CROQUDRAFT_40514 [Cronartium quercuum f. sp. fusiforme G11]